MGTVGRDHVEQESYTAGFSELARPFEYDGREKHLEPKAPIPAPRLHPGLSCRGGLSFAQKQGLGLLVASLGIAGLMVPELLLSGLSALFWVVFTVLILWRAALLAGGVALNARAKKPDKTAHETYPIYTVMIAAYREAAVMAQLAGALRRLDWPAQRLDIMLLLEEDDTETLPAALKAGFPKGTRIITVPDGSPRTKPRALNYGLARAKGDYVCIYDAEDRPDPSQLREAYAAFRAGPSKLACVQAPLVGANPDESLIAAHWSLEYAVQFRFLLPALAKLQAPIAIGGTSNHFEKDKLIAAGGWDAFNVTEDADLGLRFARLGWRVGTISQGTLEDAPTQLKVWTAQRSRWIKGFIQTWLVLMRRPSSVVKQMGGRDFAFMQLSLGGAILAPIAHGPLFVLVLLSLLTDQLSPGPAGWALLMTGWLATLIGDLLAPGLSRTSRLKAALTRPLYWPLHSVAAALALYEMIVKPHYWAKTPHTPSSEEEATCFTG